MAKVSENDILNKSVDWGLDPSNNLPFSGRAVQKFIKEQLNGKAGVFYYDATNNRYLVFTDVEARDAYLQDPTQTELIIGTFDAPFNYSAEINLNSPVYNAVFLNSTGNYIDFTFDVKNKQGTSTGENVTVTYTFIRNANKVVIRETKKYGDAVRFNVDKYLGEGTNTIIVGVIGQTSLAATTVAITYQVVNLSLTDEMDIAKSYNLALGSQVVEIPFTVSGYGTKIVEWYLDGELLDFVKSEDEVVDVTTTRTKYISLSNLQQGRHSLQFRAYTIINGENFYTDTLYRDVMIYTGADSNVIIGVALTIPREYGVLGANDAPAIYDMVQYVPYTLRFATYSPRNASNTEVVISLDGQVVGSLGSVNNITNEFSLMSKTSGTKTLVLTAGNVVYSLSVLVKETTMSLQEITNKLILDFNALGKTNQSSDKDQWSYGDYTGTLSGFNWNNTSGWVNGRLEMNAGSSFAINIAPLGGSPTRIGKTIEIEWSTKNVSNDDAIICDLRNASGVGILITATKVSMTSADGVAVETEYKSGENVRVGFVINRSSGTTNQRLSFIYANGIVSRGEKWAVSDSYTSDAQILFTATNEVEISLKAIRIYDAALTSDQMLNNYILYRDTIDSMMSVYDRNDVYGEGTAIFSPDKMMGRLPVMIVTGDIPTLENTSDKDTQIVVDIEYYNMQDASKSFRMEGAAMRPQGTSSMGYPKKNFRIYTKEVDGTILYDANGEVVENKLYAFKDGSQPVDCWCLKADYAESSGTHNTGIARLWNEALMNAQVGGEYVCRTEAQKIAIDSGYEYDVRTAIDGFPILLFYRPSVNDDLIFIGKYNFNNDKSTESVFGFTFPSGVGMDEWRNAYGDTMQCWEILNNGNALALFTTTEGFDEGWSEAFESRYPDTKTPNTRHLKAFCEWMTNVTQEDFATQKWEHLNVYMMAAYWSYLMRHAGADQFVKNAMFTSEDGQHFYFILYDNDTINGLINTGHLRIRPTDDRQTVDESGSYVFAGHDSRLWNMLEADEEFIDIVSVVDNALYSAGISYANTIHIFDDEQADKWVERVYNQDAQYKYVGPYIEKGIDNLFMLQGKRDLHRRWWLAKRFAIYDAKYVSGTYKSQAVEIKCLNGTAAGQSFSVTAGYPLDYGYGINNIPREFGVTLSIGESHTFTTEEVVNLGDPIRIYGAPNIATLDFSPMASRLAVVTIANIYDEALGTKLTKLVLGSNENTNAEVSEISGLKQAASLEYLDVQGMSKIISLDLSSQEYFKTLKAFGSGLSSVSFSKGAPVESLELPSSMRVLALEQLPYLYGANISLEDITNITGITVLSCPNVSNDFNLVYNWYVNKTTSDASCSLIMDNVDWHLSTGDEFVDFLNLKVNGGVLSVKGKVCIDSIRIEQIYAIRDILGESSFDPNAEFYVDIPSVLQIDSAESVLEGDELQFVTSIYPYLEGEYTWSIVQGREGCSIDGNGLLTTLETALDTSNVEVRVDFVSTQGEMLSANKVVSVVRRTYPQNIIINGATDPRESANYTWSSDTESVNGNYSVVWSLEGSMTSYWNIASSDLQRCLLEKTGAMPSSVSGSINMSIVRDFDGHIASRASLELSIPVVFPANATIIGNINPLESPRIYTWETTTEGVNGEFYAEWALSGDVTSVVRIASYDNNSCTMEMLEAVTEIVDGQLTLNIKKSYDGSLITSATKELQAMIEGVIMTNKTNPIMQSALYANGLVANEAYTLKEEAELITASQLNGALASISTSDKEDVLQFDEFQYFTGVTEILANTFYDFNKLTSIVIPESVTALGNGSFMYCRSLKNISLPDNITNIPYRCFYSCTSLEWIKFPANLASVDATPAAVPFNYCNALTRLYGAKVEQERYLILDGMLCLAVGADDMVIPRFVTSLIYGIVFLGTSSSTVITLHEDIVLEKGGYHFSGCTGECIVRCQLPTNVSVESDSPFYGNKFRKITVRVKNIPERAFGDCKELVDLVLEEGVESYGNRVIEKPRAIKNVYLPKSLKEIGGMLLYDSPYTYLDTNVYYSGTLSEFLTISRINDASVAPDKYNLYIAGELVSVLNIPEGVTDLPRRAFYKCISITELTLPQSLTSIGEHCFNSCWKIRKITSYNSTAPTLGSSALYRVGSDFASEGTNVLIVPFPSNGYDTWTDYLFSYGFTLRSYEPSECTSLSIVADDVIGQQTTTTIRWSAVTNGYSILTGTFYQDVIVSGEATSEAFPQNTSYTDTVARTVSYTYLGVTATTTITQGVWVDQSYTLDLNSQWQASTVANPDSTLYDGVYESFSNYKVSNTAAIMYIDILGYETFKFYVRSYAESSFDYVVVSNLDATLTNSTTTGTAVKLTTSGKQNSGTAISNYTLVEFTGIGRGEHRISVMYRKDSSSDSGTDKGYVLIPFEQE